jgi:hypothetical protein
MMEEIRARRGESSGAEFAGRNKAKAALPSVAIVGKKGYVYTLEVMIAVAIVLVAIVILFSTAQVPEASSVGLIKKQGYDVLEFLDINDELRPLVKNGDENTLKTRVRTLLTSGITIELDICTVQCSGQVPQNKNIVSVDYYVSGYKDSFFNRKVRMWMWGNF